MLISIVVPIYNVEPYIARCIRSVMDQTYEGSVECILVDDCGTDKSVEVAEKLIAEYDGPIKFRVLRHEQNRGQSAARNTGTIAANGDYIYYLDSDDAMTPDCIALMVSEIKSHPDVEMVFGDIDNVYDDGTRKEKMLYYGTPYCVNNNDWVRFQFFKADSVFMGIVVNKLIKKSFINSNQLWFKEGVIHEDDHWSFYVYQKLSYISILGKCTYLRYVREGSTMTTMTKKKTAVNMHVIIKDWIDDFDGFARSLQVYMCLELFLERVYPYVPKKTTMIVYLKLLKELLGMRKYKIAFYLVVNWLVKWRYYKLAYVMIPEAHREESERCANLLGADLKEI